MVEQDKGKSVFRIMILGMAVWVSVMNVGVCAICSVQ